MTFSRKRWETKNTVDEQGHWLYCSMEVWVSPIRVAVQEAQGFQGTENYMP
jgi:hypothetical protein